mmetsp:Transcript_10505/g.32643  ORF Transcript_10505/g.32643 Transcript_10505/m.32643 type:complete len:233 (+) Transcript_10505:545-1243(+)
MTKPNLQPSATTMGRMYHLQAGTKMTAQKPASKSLQRWRMGIALERDSVAWSKHCSQAKPTRMPMAPMSCFTASSTRPSVNSASTILSRIRMAVNESTDKTMANNTLSSISSLPTMLKLPMYQSKPKKTDHAKHMLNVVIIVSVARFTFSVRSSRIVMIRAKTTATQKAATTRSSRAWFPVWPMSTGQGSSPSWFGRWPQMRKRAHCTIWKESVRPMTSFSESAVSRLHSFS